MTALGTREIMKLVPWRQPFLMVDRVDECTPHERIVTRKTVSADDPLVSRSEWFPSVLLIEAMSQSAALLFRLSYGDEVSTERPLLGFLAANLEGTAPVGSEITFEVRSVKMTRNGGVFEGQASVSDETVATAELAFSSAPPDPAGDA
ncbi:MAG: hypothetical protein GY716_21745 [bacterium]|nr:hypothetical protein [bacterium]